MSKIWNSFSIICGWASKSMLIVAGVSLISMLVLVCVDIVGRNTSLFSSIGGTELAGYCMVFISFAGLAYTFQNDGFIRVSVIYSRFPDKVVKYVDVLLYLLATAFMVFLTKYVYILTQVSYVQGIRSQGLLQTYLYLPRIVMTLGCITMLLVAIYDLIRAVLRVCNVDTGRDYTAEDKQFGENHV